MKILVVDDDRFNLRVARDIITAASTLPASWLATRRKP